MVVDGVQKDYRIDRLQRPLLPFFCDRKNLIRNPADGAVRDGNTVDILNVGFNISSRHTLSIHRQNLFLNVLTDAGLVLFQHLRFKFALPVTGNRHIHIAKAGMQRLAAVTVTAVICVLVFVVIFAVAQFFIQFRLQTILHKFGYSLLKQILDVIHTADICHLQ